MKRQLSLRTRLLLAVSVVAVLALTVADVTVYAQLRSYLYTQVDSTLQVSHIAIESAVSNNGSDDSSSPSTGSTNSIPNSSEFCQSGRESAPGLFIEVRSSSNKVVAGEKCPAFFPGFKSYSPQLPRVITGLVKTANDPHEATRYFTVPSTVASGPEFRVRVSRLTNGGQLIVADPIDSVSSTLRKLLLIELIITGAALVGSILLGLWLVRVGLRPLREVVRTADSISGGDLTGRIPNATSNTEVGHVSSAINVMLERIESSFSELQASENRLRRFVSDASHELKTPIAAVSAYAQLFHRGAGTRQEDLNRVMDGIERETARMADLVEDLLAIARFDQENSLEFEPVELVGLSAEAVETSRLVGPGWPIILHASEPLEVLGNWSALRQVLDNLLSNVRAHTPSGTPVQVSVLRDGDNAVVEVADEGPGFSEADAGALFDRFFRTDSSRSRSTGGSGLGLAIVAAIVHAHGGEVSASPRTGGGAVFRVVLPLLA